MLMTILTSSINQAITPWLYQSLDKKEFEKIGKVLHIFFIFNNSDTFLFKSTIPNTPPNDNCKPKLLIRNGLYTNKISNAKDNDDMYHYFYILILPMLNFIMTAIISQCIFP